MIAVVSPTIAENIQKLNEIVPQALAWSNTHVCHFDFAKFELIHFTRNNNLYEPLSLLIEGMEAKAKDD